MDMKELINELGNLTDEQRTVLVSLLQKETPVVEPASEEVAVPFMDSVEETDIPKMTIAEVKSMKPSRRVPVRTQKPAPFGIEKDCINKNGEKYDYIRNAFDGQVTQLDEVHQEMKKHFIAHSRSLITAYNAVNGFCGAGPQAITMYEPGNEFANKDGKVFYRWTGEHTAELMDELWPLVVPFKEAMEKAVEETKARQSEGGDDQ